MINVLFATAAVCLPHPRASTCVVLLVLFLVSSFLFGSLFSSFLPGCLFRPSCLVSWFAVLVWFHASLVLCGFLLRRSCVVSCFAVLVWFLAWLLGSPFLSGFLIRPSCLLSFFFFLPSCLCSCLVLLCLLFCFRPFLHGCLLRPSLSVFSLFVHLICFSWRGCYTPKKTPHTSRERFAGEITTTTTSMLYC